MSFDIQPRKSIPQSKSWPNASTEVRGGPSLPSLSLSWFQLMMTSSSSLHAPDRTVEALTGGQKSAEVFLFRRSIHEALRAGECCVALHGTDACGVAVWLSPRSDWRFQ